MVSSKIVSVLEQTIDIRLGNAIELIKQLPAESIDCVVTDPPYKVTSRGNAGNAGGMFTKKVNMQGRVFAENDVKITDFASELYRVLKEQTHCYVMCNQINLQPYLNELTRVGFKVTRVLVWDKGNKINNQFYMGQVEFIIFCRKGKAKRVNNCGISELIAIPNKKTKRKDGTNYHDTEKPVALMQLLIEQSTEAGGVVLDPFVGIGATPIACVKSGRNFIGYELDMEYYSIAVVRLNKLRGKLNDRTFTTRTN